MLLASAATPQTTRKDHCPKGWSEIGRLDAPAACMGMSPCGASEASIHPDCAPTRSPARPSTGSSFRPYTRSHPATTPVCHATSTLPPHRAPLRGSAGVPASAPAHASRPGRQCAGRSVPMRQARWLPRLGRWCWAHSPWQRVGVFWQQPRGGPWWSGRKRRGVRPRHCCSSAHLGNPGTTGCYLLACLCSFGQARRWLQDLRPLCAPPRALARRCTARPPDSFQPCVAAYPATRASTSRACSAVTAGPPACPVQATNWSGRTSTSGAP